MANQSTQRYIDGEKDWITAMLASQPIVEGKSSEQVEKLLIQEIKEPEEIDIDPDIEKEIADIFNYLVKLVDIMPTYYIR